MLAKEAGADPARNEEANSEALQEEQALWQLWLKEKTAALRTQLFFFYVQWSRMLAAKVLTAYPHPLAEWADYVNLASIGLLQAIDRFDVTLKTRFKSYAEPFVRGSILKGLACYVKDRQQASRDRLESLTSDNQFGENGNDFDRVVNAAVDMAFGYFLEMGIVNADPVDNSPLRIYEQEHRDQGLEQMVERLPERERQVIVGHYFQFLSFVDISQLMGVSKVRISQLHAQALKRIRQFYEALDNADGYF